MSSSPSRSPPHRQQGVAGVSRKVSAPSAVETSAVSTRSPKQRRRLTEFEKQLRSLATARPGSQPGSGVRREAASSGTVSGGAAAPGDQMAALERWRAPRPPPSSSPASACSFTARAEERLKRLEKYEANLDSGMGAESGAIWRGDGRYAAPRAWTGSPAWVAQLEGQLKLAGAAEDPGHDENGEEWINDQLSAISGEINALVRKQFKGKGL